MKSAAQTTSTPATSPVITAEMLVTNAQGAVIATRPASMPFAIMLGCGLPCRGRSKTNARGLVRAGIDESPHECWRDWHCGARSDDCAESTQMSIDAR
jgi:hypothetical protein